MSMLPEATCPECGCDCECHRKPGVHHIVPCCPHSGRQSDSSFLRNLPKIRGPHRAITAEEICRKDDLPDLMRGVEEHAQQVLEEVHRVGVIPPRVEKFIQVDFEISPEKE